MYVGRNEPFDNPHDAVGDSRTADHLADRPRPNPRLESLL